MTTITQHILLRANGAIKRFQRHGLKQDGVYGKIDNLHITLDGNRVRSVTDDALPVTREGAGDFNADGGAFTYDACGNMTSDSSRGIASITYDNLNHPVRAQFTDGSLTEWVYSADGTKLRTVHTTVTDGVTVPMGSTVELTPDMVLYRDTTDYRGPLVIENGQLARVLFAGGYAEIRESDKVPVYHYYTLDHIGNVRAVTREDGAVVQQTDYYPFGGVIADRGFGRAVQPHKTAGKELDMMHGLGWADFGARRYDPVLPQWTQPDPMAEKAPHMSPYRYCFNNPMRYTDRTGLFETEDEAKEWMKLKGFSNDSSSGYSIQKMNDGLWSVVDESNSVTYHKDKSLDKYKYVAGRDGDGVIKSAIASPRVSGGNMAWNSDLARTIVPDIVSVGVGGTAIAGTGAGTSFELNWVTRGPDASWRPILSVTQSVGVGFSVDATLNIGGSYYLGPVQDIRRDNINTSIKNGNVSLFYSGGVAEGGKIGGTISTVLSPKIEMVNLQLNLGISIPSPIGINGATGVSNTYILY